MRCGNGERTDYVVLERLEPGQRPGASAELASQTHEHARLGRDPRRQPIKVLVRDLFEHVSLVLVEGGDAAGVSEEAVETPLVEQDEDHGLGGRARRQEHERITAGGGINNSRRLEVGVGRVQVDDLENRLRTGDEAQAHA